MICPSCKTLIFCPACGGERLNAPATVAMAEEIERLRSQYNDLADAVGADCMDSHESRVQLARRLASKS